MDFLGCLLITIIDIGNVNSNHTGTSHIELEVYFPYQLNLEIAKYLLDVEVPHHCNIFFLRVWGVCGQPSAAVDLFCNYLYLFSD